MKLGSFIGKPSFKNLRKWRSLRAWIVAISVGFQAIILAIGLIYAYQQLNEAKAQRQKHYSAKAFEFCTDKDYLNSLVRIRAMFTQLEMLALQQGVTNQVKAGTDYDCKKAIQAVYASSDNTLLEYDIYMLVQPIITTRVFCEMADEEKARALQVVSTDFKSMRAYLLRLYPCAPRMYDKLKQGVFVIDELVPSQETHQ